MKWILIVWIVTSNISPVTVATYSDVSYCEQAAAVWKNYKSPIHTLRFEAICLPQK